MTSLLKQAFDIASKLPEPLQDELGLKLLQDIETELKWDETFEKTEDELAKLSAMAIEDFKARRMRQMGFDEL